MKRHVGVWSTRTIWLFLVGLFTFSQILLPTKVAAWGSPITGDELKQLDESTNWVADTCGAASVTTTPSGSKTDITDIVNKYKLQSAMIQKVNGDVVAESNADTPPTTPASTMKLIVADTVLRSGVDLSKNVPVTSDLYYNGSNDLGKSSVTLSEALQAMLSVSSNVGANVLMKAMGGVGPFTQKAQGYGYTHTTVNGYYDPSNDGKNTSTISDEVAAMNHIFSTNSTNYTNAQNYLKSAATNDNHYNVDGVIANKWAGTDTVAGNVGLFKVNSDFYVIGLYYNGSDSSSDAINAIRNGSADLLNAINSGGGPSLPGAGASGCCSSAATTAPASGTLSVPSNFSLKQKIGQLLFVGVTDAGTATSLESKYQIGGFLLNTGGSSFSYSSSDTDQIKSAGDLPALFAVDEEGGLVDRMGLNIPSAEAMGKMSTDQVKQNGQLVGKKMSDLGINIDFAPVLDLNNGANQAISGPNRSFAKAKDNLTDQVNTITNKAGAFAEGLESSGVTPTFKHFPGLGRAKGSTGGNTDTGSATTPPLSSLEANDLKPYASIMQSLSGQNAIMVGNQIVPGLTNGQPASINKATYDLLHNKYSFGGVTITDDLSAGAIPENLSNAVVDAISAGAVMPLFNPTSTSEVDSVVNAVATAVNSGKISQSVIDKDLKVVLSLKNSSGSGASADNAAAGGCCSAGGGAVSGSISPQVGKGLPSADQQNLQKAIVNGATKWHVNPNLLAAIYYEEQFQGGDSGGDNLTGREVGDGAWRDPAPPYGHGPPWNTSSTGAQGPFEFEPYSWPGYKQDGNGDGKEDPLNLFDAAMAAAKLLAANGAANTTDKNKIVSAAAHYNGSGPQALNYGENAYSIMTHLDAGGGVSVSGGGCSGSADCSASTGTEKILCAAKAYEGIYYEYGGGHQGYSAFKAGCPDPSNPPNNKPTGGPVNGDPAGKSGNPSPCGLDCSGLVSVAVDDAFNQNYIWTVSGSMQGAGANDWHSIPMNQAKAGDIVTSSGHVEIVDHVSGGKVYTFGAHDTGEKIGPTSFDASYFTGGAWRWAGPGA